MASLDLSYIAHIVWHRLAIFSNSGHPDIAYFISILISVIYGVWSLSCRLSVYWSNVLALLSRVVQYMLNVIDNVVACLSSNELPLIDQGHVGDASCIHHNI